MDKEIVYVDIDGVVANYIKQYQDVKAQTGLEFPQSTIGFFRTLELMPEAKMAIDTLRQYYNVYFLTRPSFENTHFYTERAEWVLEHFGFEMMKRLHIVGDKSLSIGHYLIDDSLNANQASFQGKFIHFGQSEYPSWGKVMEELVPTVKAIWYERYEGKNHYRYLLSNDRPHNIEFGTVIKGISHYEINSNFRNLTGIEPNSIHHFKGIVTENNCFFNI